MARPYSGCRSAGAVRAANRCKGKRGSLALVLRGLRLLFFTSIFLAVTVAVVYLFVPLVGDLSNESLAHSVARQIETKGELEKASCRKRGKERFTCRVRGGSGKRAATYRVKMDDRRCYTARRTKGQGKRRKKGCVGLRDQLRLGLLEQIL